MFSSKKIVFWFILPLCLFAIALVVGIGLYWRAHLSVGETVVTPNNSITASSTNFQELSVPLSEVPNYQAIKTKYGLSLTAEQENFLAQNKFLLVDLKQASFFQSGMNFDQWLVDSDRLGGASLIYGRLPEDTVLITPDTVLHAYHKYFELTLEQLEQHELNQSLGDFLISLNANLKEAVKNSSGPVQVRYQSLLAQLTLARILFENKSLPKPDYFSDPEAETTYADNDKTIDSLANAQKLLEKYGTDLTPALKASVAEELPKIYAADNVGISALFSQYDPELNTDYTQFTPRSHYTKNSTLRAYFRTMMYLGRSPYLLGSDLGIADANLLAKQMARANNRIKPFDYWRRISQVTSFYVGESDDISYDEWSQFVQSVIGANVTDDALISSENIAKLVFNMDKLPTPRILSDVIVSEDMSSKTKADLLRQSLSFRIFGQKFTYDAWILNDLTAGQEKTDVRLPSMPSALFVPAAFGNQTARQDSVEFLKQSGFSNTDLTGFLGKLDNKAADISQVKTDDWFKSLGSAWLYILGSFSGRFDTSYPLYMQSAPFNDKQVQTFLGSYTELKHDTLLYAKQSYAELGAGGDGDIIPPVVKGFVEPNLEFWQRFNLLLSKTDQLFNDNQLFVDESARDRLHQFMDISSFYEGIAKQELAGTSISDDDYEKLRITKLSFIAQPFEPLDPTETSGQTALIADVHTDALTSKILYEATGEPYLMLALVGNEASPRLTAGFAYSHYELTGALGKRLSDEDWRGQVYGGQLPAKNFWYESLK
jgi:hypothetical protein